MALFIALGNYTSKSMAGFVRNPSQDRRAAVEAMAAKTGAKLLDFYTTRGQYDFCATVDGTFAQAAAVKIMTSAVDAIENMVILEAISFEDSATLAKSIADTYVAPSKT